MSSPTKVEKKNPKKKKNKGVDVNEKKSFHNNNRWRGIFDI